MTDIISVFDLHMVHTNIKVPGTQSVTANGTYLTLSFHLSSSLLLHDCIPLEITCIFHHQPKQAQREKKSHRR